MSQILDTLDHLVARRCLDLADDDLSRVRHGAIAEMRHLVRLWPCGCFQVCEVRDCSGGGIGMERGWNEADRQHDMNADVRRFSLRHFAPPRSPIRLSPE